MGVDWSATVAAELKKKIEALEIDVKAIKQQLAEILNQGPTIIQKKMWLDKIMELELKVLQKVFEEQIRKQLKTIKGFPDDFEIDWDLKLDKEAIKRLNKLK